jgi:3-methyladenine DNA glycosylase AlkD
MITKAVSWVLREMTKSHPDQVAAYLKENREVLAAHVVREVNNKLCTGLKRGEVKSEAKRT